MEIPHTVAVVADPDAGVPRDHIVLNSQDGRPRFLSFIFHILTFHIINYLRDVLLRKKCFLSRIAQISPILPNLSLCHRDGLNPSSPASGIFLHAKTPQKCKNSPK